MVSAETLLNYPDWKIPFTVHTDAPDKQLGAVISQNNKLFPSSNKIEQATAQLHYNIDRTSCHSGMP